GPKTAPAAFSTLVFVVRIPQWILHIVCNVVRASRPFRTWNGRRMGRGYASGSRTLADAPARPGIRADVGRLVLGLLAVGSSVPVRLPVVCIDSGSRLARDVLDRNRSGIVDTMDSDASAGKPRVAGTSGGAEAGPQRRTADCGSQGVAAGDFSRKDVVD